MTGQAKAQAAPGEASFGAPPYDPVLLDLDGTLVDSSPAIVATMRAACAAVGRPLDRARDLSFCVGPPLEENLAALLGDPDLVASAAQAYRARYRSELHRASDPMPGAAQALEAFARAGVAVAVVTNKPTPLAEDVLEASGLRTLIGPVLGRAPEQPRTKAQLLVEALGRLQPHRSTPLYIGDHAEDRLAADAVGMGFAAYGPHSWADLEDLVLGRARCALTGP